MAKEKETIPVSIITLTIGIAVTGISVWYGQNNHLLPEQVSQQAPLVDNFFNIMVTIGTALFLVVEGAIIFALIKFRHRPGDETDSPPIRENFSLEVFWTAVPAFIVIALGVYSVQLYNQMGGFDAVGQVAHHHHHHAVQVASVPQTGAGPLLADANRRGHYGVGATPEEGLIPPDLRVDVLGMQYAWIFTYPDLGITSGELHIPVGEDVQLSMTAQDVLHAFWLPEFRLKQDVIPGQKTQLRFVATKTGRYPVVCAELCGAYHGGMRSEVVVHDQNEFEAWITANQIAQNPDLDNAVAIHGNVPVQLGLESGAISTAAVP